MSQSLTIDEEWNKFILGKSSLDIVLNKKVLTPNVLLPKSTPIYISTKTMITYLNQPIDIRIIFFGTYQLLNIINQLMELLKKQYKDELV